MNEAKKEFIKDTKGAFKKYINCRFDPNNMDLLKAAVLQGYDDAKRTFTGIGSKKSLEDKTFWEKNEKDKFLGFVATKIQKTFCGICDFDEIHNKICVKICEWFSDRSFEANYGQAQKILNMAYKYLYCLSGAECYEVFKKCHMPLDGFTLEWYKRFVWEKEKPRIYADSKWSSLEQSTYRGVAEAIKEHLENGARFYVKGAERDLPVYPLDAEFYIWPEMQMHMAAESFLFSFKALTTDEKKAWKKDANARNKLVEIQKAIHDYL